MSTFATAAAGRFMLACTPVQALFQGRGMTTASILRTLTGPAGPAGAASRSAA